MMKEEQGFLVAIPLQYVTISHMEVDYESLIVKHGGIRAAARALGMPHTSLQYKLAAHKLKTQSAAKRIFFFSDTHDTPTQDKAHLYHIAKHIKETKPDIIVHGGDLWDCVSLCHHVPNNSHKAKSKPTLKQDLDSLHEAAQILTEESGRNDFHFLLGNHENWMYQFEDKNPELFGFAQESFDAIFKSVGWTVYPYTRYVELGGINFVHAPINMMGKARAGENAAKQASTRAIKDVVFGHTHRWSYHREPKDGNDIWVTAINAGCTMPDGYRPDYAVGPLGWYYGCLEFSTQDGQIQDDVSQVSLKLLRERYG
jgi:predicted MPP superfamily phosphohydrolase